MDADKDLKIEELTFENRALRQNAIDEKEVLCNSLQLAKLIYVPIDPHL